MKIAIFDRDGTLNPWGEEYIAHPDQWQALPGALQALARLNRAGWHIVVASNQPGLGRGLFDAQTLNAVQTKMLRQLSALGGRIDAFFYCPHVPDEACYCRKPSPGLLVQIAERYGMEPRHLCVVGSSLDHLQAGAALGAQLHLVCTGSSAQLRAQALPPGVPEGTQVHADLASFVDQLLQQAQDQEPLLSQF